ncbi:MAG: iron-containing alcohol dehydrogenase [Bacteroidales bacterium]
MENFVIYNPVKVHFGKDVVSKLGEAAIPLGKKALLVYGKGSVKRNGAYDQTVSSLSEGGVEIVEFDGIKSNPVIEDVDKAASLGRSENVDMVVAVGGGSVIDSAKYIALTIPVDHSGWEFATGNKKPSGALPIIAVLTLAATGTEMNPVAVVQSDKEKKKVGNGHPLMFPKHSFLDPSFTRSVPKNYTAYGIVDLVAHALEGWFGEGDATLTDRFILSIIREAMDYGPELMKDPENYQLRAKIMFAATMALNGLTAQGKKSGDWGTHGIGHAMSVLWDIPHGASLSIAFPAWMKLHRERIPERLIKLGEGLFGIKDADETIRRFEEFFASLDSPLKISGTDAPTGPEAKEELLEVMRINKVSGFCHKLSEEDHRILVDSMM